MKIYHDFCMTTATMSMASQAIVEVIQSRKCVKMKAQERTTKVHGG